MEFLAGYGFQPNNKAAGAGLAYPACQEWNLNGTLSFVFRAEKLDIQEAAPWQLRRKAPAPSNFYLGCHPIT
jgi:hypothetical protein